MKFEVVNSQHGTKYVQYNNQTDNTVKKLLDISQFMEIVSSYKKESNARVVQVTESTHEGMKTFIEIL